MLIYCCYKLHYKEELILTRAVRENSVKVMCESAQDFHVIRRRCRVSARLLDARCLRSGRDAHLRGRQAPSSPTAPAHRRQQL